MLATCSRARAGGRSPGGLRRRAEPADPQNIGAKRVPFIEIVTPRSDPTSRRDLRREVLRDALQTIRGEYVNTDTGWTIDVTGEQLKKTVSGTRSHADLAAAQHIPDVIRSMVKVVDRPSGRGNENVPRITRFVAAARYNGKPYRVWVTVRGIAVEGELRRQYYTHELGQIRLEPVEETGSSGQDPAVLANGGNRRAPPRRSASTSTTTGHDTDVASLMRDVKLDPKDVSGYLLEEPRYSASQR